MYLTIRNEFDIMLIITYLIRAGFARARSPPLIRTSTGKSAKVLANLGSCTAINGAGVEIKETTARKGVEIYFLGDLQK